MDLKRYDIIVVGGGISGLSLAHYASKAGLKTLLLEKAPEAGGCLRTMRQVDDFWLELGAHTCYNSYGNLIGVIEDCGLREKLLGPGKGALHDVRRRQGEVHPFGTRLS